MTISSKEWLLLGLATAAAYFVSRWNVLPSRPFVLAPVGGQPLIGLAPGVPPANSDLLARARAELGGSAIVDPVSTVTSNPLDNPLIHNTPDILDSYNLDVPDVGLV